MLSLALLGVALLLVPAVPSGVSGAGGVRSSQASRASRASRAPSRRLLQGAASIAAALASVLAVGVPAGLFAGAALGPTAWVVIDRLYDRPVRTQPTRALARALELIAAALHAGLPPGAAVLIGADAADEPARGLLVRAGRALELGADADEAWQPLADDAVLAQVATAARRSAASGARLATAFDQLASDVRAQVAAAAQARAERVGVLAVGPLGLCFLPAFVCLGIVPVLVGIASGVLPALH